MKKCPWCGQEYPDEVSVCVVDQNPLESSEPAPPPPPAPEESKVVSVEASDTSTQDEADADAPEGFRDLGRFDPLEANRLLKRFADAGIRFQIDRVEKQVQTGRGFRKVGLVEIYVHQDDEDGARKIFTAGWKV